MVGELGADSDGAAKDGMIFPMNVHLLLLWDAGVSVAGFACCFSLFSSFVTSPMIDCRLYALDGFRDKLEGLLVVIKPSNPRKRLGAGICVSLRMIRNRRPGAGRHGVVEGGGRSKVSAFCFR